MSVLFPFFALFLFTFFTFTDVIQAKEYRFDESQLTTWRKVPSPQGVAFVVHGLNLKPSKMNELVKVLNGLQIDVLRVGLAGHRGSEEEHKHITREIWLKDVFDNYSLACAHAIALKKRLYFLGYSLGALLFLDLLNNAPGSALEKDRINVGKAILLAPAIALPWYTHLIKVFNIFGGTFMVMSMNRPDYRSLPGTSVAAYNAFFESIEALDISKHKHSNSIRTLVIIDPKDELVSLRKIRDVVKRHHLHRWKIVELPSGHRRRHHLIVDRESLGQERWKKQIQAISHFIQGP